MNKKQRETLEAFIKLYGSRTAIKHAHSALVNLTYEVSIVQHTPERLVDPNMIQRIAKVLIAIETLAVMCDREQQVKIAVDLLHKELSIKMSEVEMPGKNEKGA